MANQRHQHGNIISIMAKISWRNGGVKILKSHGL